MKRVITLFLFILILSCAGSEHIYEERFIKTKIYVGRFETSEVYGKTTFIQTSYAVFTVKGIVEVPDSVLCYIRRELPRYDMHPDIEWQLEHQYFSWVGSEEYKLFKNVRIRNEKIYY